MDNGQQVWVEMEKQQVAFVAPIFHTQTGWGWTYFRVPDGNIYQLQGACQVQTNKASALRC